MSAGADPLGVALAGRAEPGARVELGDVVTRSGVLAINVRGTYPPVRWLPGWVPTVGDRVRVLVAHGEYLVLGRVLSGPLRATGTVTAAGGGGARCTVLAGGVSYSCLRNVAYTPVVGHVVRLDWSEPTPWVIGQSSTDVPPPSSDPAPPPPPPAPGGTGVTSFAAVASGYFSTTYGWSGATSWGSRLMQGTSGGTNTGAWFYGAGPRSLAGRTISRAEVFVHRTPGYGAGGVSTVHLYRHTSDARPGGNVALVAGPTDVARARGQADWVDVPTAWAQAIVDDGGGLGIYGSPYLVLEGIREDPQSGLLRLTWAR